MSKTKFIYNIHTLTFEQVEETLKTKVVKGFMFFSAATVYAAIAIAIAYRFMDSPKEKVQRREIEKMKQELQVANKQLDKLTAAVNNLHSRDNGIYRAMTEQEPIDDDIWFAGIGGSDRHEDLNNMSERDLLIKTREKVEKLKYRISLQSDSYKKIVEAHDRKEDLLASIPTIIPVREDKLNKDKNLMSGFGYRLHPVFKVWKLHTGIDFGARIGTPIYSTGKGTVVKVEHASSGYGKNVIISHGYGFETLYGHMSEILVRPGQKVERGMVIGKVGSTGTSTAPHLHYEVIKNGDKVNPMPYCLDGLTPQEYQNFVEGASQTGVSFDFAPEK